MKRSSIAFRLTLLACALALSGCGGGGSLLGGGSSCTPHTITLNFPSTAGYSASGTLSSSTSCFSTATVTTYASTLPILGSGYTPSDPSAQVLLYLALSFSATEYASGMPGLTVTVPAGTVTSSQKFYLVANRSGGSAFGWNAVAGPVSASGSTITFGSAGGNTTFDSGEEDELAIYSTP